MPSKSERRFAIDGWQNVEFQVRAAEEGDGMTFEGYAAVFDTDSDGSIPGWGVERIAPTAFDKSLKDGRDIKMFLNHNSDLVLASRDAGTLELDKDSTGLMARARFIDTTLGIDTAKNVRAGNVSKMSFGFTPVRFNQRKDVEGVTHTEVRLWEVSPVTSWPAYTATSATVRHIAELTDTDPDELAEAFRVLEAPEEALTDEQFNTLLRVLNTRRGEREPVLAPNVAAWRQKLDAYGLQ